MTKTIKELLDEQIEDFKTDFPAMEGYLDTEVREGMIRMLKDSQLEITSQVEALVRREVVEETVATLEKREAVLQELVDKYNLDIDRHRLMEVQSIRIPLQAQIKEIEEKV